LLEKDFSIILVDLPGFGGTTFSTNFTTLTDYVVFVKKFLKKINQEPRVMVGHSFGCRILLKAFGSQTLTARKLALIGAAGLSESENFKIKFLCMLSKVFKNFSPSIFKDWFYNFIGSDYRKNGKLSVVYQNILKEDLRTCAAEIKVPTLLVYGEKDISTPVSYGKIFKNIIKNSRLEVLPLGGHFVHVEEAEKVASLIKTFVYE
jgi:pimeloyl-ACP methyl ester carboxylesterase